MERGCAGQEARAPSAVLGSEREQGQERPSGVGMNRLGGQQPWLCQPDILAQHQLGVICSHCHGEPQFRESDRQERGLLCQGAP